MNDSQLDHLLKSCTAQQTPQGFHTDVWNRIAVEPTSAGMLSALHRLFSEIFTRLSQPAAAFATCAVFVTVGSLIGIDSRPELPTSEVRYVQTVSPFIHQSSR